MTLKAKCAWCAWLVCIALLIPTAWREFRKPERMMLREGEKVLVVLKPGDKHKGFVTFEEAIAWLGDKKGEVLFLPCGEIAVKDSVAIPEEVERYFKGSKVWKDCQGCHEND